MARDNMRKHRAYQRKITGPEHNGPTNSQVHRLDGRVASHRLNGAGPLPDCPTLLLGHQGAFHWSVIHGPRPHDYPGTRCSLPALPSPPPAPCAPGLPGGDWWDAADAPFSGQAASSPLGAPDTGTGTEYLGIWDPAGSPSLHRRLLLPPQNRK